MMAIFGPYKSLTAIATDITQVRVFLTLLIHYAISRAFFWWKRSASSTIRHRICRKNQGLFVRQHAHCIQMRICMPEEDGNMLSPISTFMILEVKPAKSLRISFMAAEWSSSSDSTKSSLKAGTLTFSGSKKSRLLPFSVESGWTGLFSGAL